MTKSRKQFVKGGDTHIINTLTGEEYYAPCEWGLLELLNELSEENGQLKKVNNLLYNENIQLRRILVNYKDLIYDVKYLEEKRVFDGEKDKKNIWDVEPVVEKHS